jgi:hypothetical protein
MAKPKKDQTEIQINDRFKIIRQDALNWAVYERRAVDKRDGSSAVEWINANAFFGNVEHAIEWIARKLDDNGEVQTLEEYVKAIKASHRKLSRDVAKALEAM